MRGVAQGSRASLTRPPNSPWQGLWDNDKTERDQDVSNRGFPHPGHKPSKLRPSSTDSLGTISPTVSEERSFPTMQNAKRGAEEVCVKGENQTS